MTVELRSRITIGLALLLMPLCLGAAELRIALIPTEPSAATMVDLLTAQFTKERGLALLERSEIVRVQRELGLNAIQSASSLRIGEALGADGVVMIEPRLQQPNSSMAVTLIAVKPGVLLSVAHYPWPLPDANEWA